MESKKIDLNALKSKILVIVPNINDSVITAGIIAQVINRLDVSFFFVNNNELDKTEISPEIESIYVIGIGEQNCEAARIQAFIDVNQEKICFWANNKSLPNHLMISIEACPNLNMFVNGNKHSLPLFLINTLGIKDVPKELKETIAALSSGGMKWNRLAERIRYATRAAEVMEQYNERCVTAETRKTLLKELLLQEDVQAITDMFGLSLKIQTETLTALQRVIDFGHGLGLISQKKQIFDRNEIFGYFLGRFRFFAIQYRNVQGENFTEICANKNYRESLKLIADSLDNDFKISFIGSKLIIPGDWKKAQEIIVKKIMTAELNC